MNRKELIIIRFGLGFTIPLIIFVIFWWSISLVNIYNIVTISELYIKVISIIGIFTGIIVDILYLRRISDMIYRINIPFLIVIYLFCSIMTVAFFMGIPIGNLILGIIAGIYIGRRYHNNQRNHLEFKTVLKNVAIFTASVTTFEALSIGILALQEKSSIIAINQFIGREILLTNTFVDFAIIIFLCIVLFIIQYFFTKISSRYAFSI